MRTLGHTWLGGFVRLLKNFPVFARARFFLLDFNADFSTFLYQIQDEILQQSSSQNHHEE